MAHVLRLDNSVNMDLLLSHALERVGCPSLSLSSEQKAGIASILDGKDVFMTLPTACVSICYEILPFVLDKKLGKENSLVIVISPLLSLLIDQVHNLRSRSIKAAVMCSASQLEKEKQLIATEEDLASCSHLFCTPEALEHRRWRDAVYSSPRVVAIAVDQAHCLLKQCQFYRPSFEIIHELRSLVPSGTPVVACNSTAITKRDQKEVTRCLSMPPCNCEFISARPQCANIYYKVLPRTEIDGDLNFLMEALKEQKNKAPRAIVYCRSMEMCADLYAHFHHKLGESSYYPAGVPHLCRFRIFDMFHSCTCSDVKRTILKSFDDPNGMTRVVFATAAFGMEGVVNTKSVNTIIHYGAPHSLVDYLQESGRGGQNGEQAESVVFWKQSECKTRRHFSKAQEREVTAVRKYLEDDTLCRRQRLLEYFDPSWASRGVDPLTCCDVCAKQYQ